MVGPIAANQHPGHARAESHELRDEPHAGDTVDAFAADIRDLPLYKGLARAACQPQMLLALARVAARGPIPSAAAYVLTDIGTPGANQTLHDFFLEPHVREKIAGAVTMAGLPLLEKAIFANHEFTWEQPRSATETNAQLKSLEDEHVTEAINRALGILETASSVGAGATSFLHAIRVSDCGVGPVISLSIGLGVSFLAIIASNLALTTRIRKAGAHQDLRNMNASSTVEGSAYRAGAANIDKRTSDWKTRTSFGVSGGLGALGAMAGVIASIPGYHGDEGAKWGMNNLIPAIGAACAISMAFIDLAIQMQKAPKAFILAKADYARREDHRPT